MYLEVERRLTSGHCLLTNDPFLSSACIPVLSWQAESFFLFRAAPGLAVEWTHLYSHLKLLYVQPPGTQGSCVIRAAVPDLYKIPSFSPTTLQPLWGLGSVTPQVLPMLLEEVPPGSEAFTLCHYIGESLLCSWASQLPKDQSQKIPILIGILWYLFRKPLRDWSVSSFSHFHLHIHW